MELFYSGNTNVLELRGLRNAATGVYDNSATVNCVITDGAGAVLDTQAMQPVVENPNQGKYRATVLHSVALITNRTYKATVTATTNDGLVGKWTLPIMSQIRGFDE
jgi:hypothetical protein